MMYRDLHSAIRDAYDRIDYGHVVDPSHWQGVVTNGRPDMVTRELIGHAFSAPVPPSVDELQCQCRPNLPWAEEHFLERVAGSPTNPGDTYVRWPHWRSQEEATMVDGKFTHSYQERYWPHGYRGIRYDYGDLGDVVALLRKHPTTRQAYLPVYFPEDTGSLHGGRTPCSIGYGFLMRGGNLNCFYTIRSVDIYRHFADDVYLTARLLQWVLAATGWTDVKPGFLHMTCFSLHLHNADRRKFDVHKRRHTTEKGTQEMAPSAPADQG